MLGFDLLPRIKAINRVRLYRPGPGHSYPWLAQRWWADPVKLRCRLAGGTLGACGCTTWGPSITRSRRSGTSKTTSATPGG
jgi:hypothetical protein